MSGWYILDGHMAKWLAAISLVVEGTAVAGSNMSFENLMPAGSGTYTSEAKMASMPTLKQRLDLAVTQAKERLQAVEEAREIFERNPDIERLLDLMQRSHF